MFEKIKNGFITGFSFAAGVISMTLLAVTVGNVNTFNAGEPLSSSKLNENFINLKTAIESLNTEVETVKTSLGNVNTELGLTKTDLSNAQTNLTNVNTSLNTTQSAVFNTQSTLTTVSTDLATTQSTVSGINTNLNNLQTTDTTLNGRVTTLENNLIAINSVPVGTIVAWHESLSGVPSLPNGWVRCNGQTLSDTSSPLNGQVIPNLNGQKNTWNSKGLFLRGHITSGVIEDDSFQGHWHKTFMGQIINNYSIFLVGASNRDVLLKDTNIPTALIAADIFSDGINGEPRMRIKG